MSPKKTPRSEHMLSRARELRKNLTEPERRLWSLLRDRRLDDLKFRRQHAVGRYVADFCCISQKLIVELDGMSHDNRGAADAVRTAALEAMGFRVFRVGNDDVLSDPEAVLIGIARQCGVDVTKWQ